MKVYYLPLFLFVLGCAIQTGAPVQTLTEPEVISNATINETEEVETEAEGEVFKRLGLHKGNLSVYFIDDSGFSAAIITPDGKLLVVDAGVSRNSKKNLNAIRDLGYAKADAMVISSTKSYRVGGIPLLVDRLKPSQGFYSGISNEANEEFRLVKSYLSNFTKVGQDTVILVSDSIEVRLLVPYDDGKGFSLGDAQNSIVVKIIYGDFSIVLGSDCYDECEDRLSNNFLGADILALPLMGRCESDGSASTYFLRTIGAEINIGSVICEDVSSKLQSLTLESHDTTDGQFVITTDGTTFTTYKVVS